MRAREEERRVRGEVAKDSGSWIWRPQAGIQALDIQYQRSELGHLEGGASFQLVRRPSSSLKWPLGTHQNEEYPSGRIPRGFLVRDRGPVGDEVTMRVRVWRGTFKLEAAGIWPIRQASRRTRSMIEICM